jgi:hypothetical protein
MIGRCPAALGAAAVLVLSAGIARNYDGIYLLGEGEGIHLLTPFIASLFIAGVLQTILSQALGRKTGHFRELPAFVSLLTLYWVTAPIAWLYAVPYERWLAPYDAAVANLWTLAVVSLWRVLLISRVVAVLYQAPYLTALAIVLMMADGLIVIAGFFAGMTVGLAHGMSGVRLSETDQLMAAFAQVVTWTGVWGFVPVLVLALRGLKRYTGSWALQHAPRVRARSTLWVGAAASIIAWMPILPHTQAEQQLAAEVATLLKSERTVGEAVALMSGHQRSEFPPHWHSEFRPSRHRVPDEILWVLNRTTQEPAALWVHQMYVDALRASLGELTIIMDADLIPRLARLLPQLEEGPQLARMIVPLINKLESDGGQSRYGEPEDFRTLRELAGEPPAAKGSG